MSLFQSLAVVAAQQGKMIVAGLTTIASDDQEIETGLASVDHCFVAMNSPPNDTHSQCSALPHSTAGSIQILSFKPGAGADATPEAATPPWSAVHWIAVGDAPSSTLFQAMGAPAASPRLRFASGVADAAAVGSVDIVTGLATCLYVGAAPSGTATLDHSQNSAGKLSAWGQFRLRSQGATSAGDATPTQSVASIDRMWWAIGT